VLISIAGWINQQQQQAIEYLREENKVLREQLGGRRLRLRTNSAVDWLSKRMDSGTALWRPWQRSSRLRLSLPGTGS
jgi:hypothetical protein